MFDALTRRTFCTDVLLLTVALQCVYLTRGFLCHVFDGLCSWLFPSREGVRCRWIGHQRRRCLRYGWRRRLLARCCPPQDGMRIGWLRGRAGGAATTAARRNERELKSMACWKLYKVWLKATQNPPELLDRIKVVVDMAAQGRLMSSRKKSKSKDANAAAPHEPPQQVHGDHYESSWVQVAKRG